MEWWQWLIVVGSVPVAGFLLKIVPLVVSLLTGYGTQTRQTRSDLDTRQERFDLAYEERVKELVSQVNAAQQQALEMVRQNAALLLLETEKRAAAMAELNALKVGMALQMDQIHTLVNSQKSAMELHIKELMEANEVLIAKVTRLEEAQAHSLLKPKLAAGD